MSPPVEPEFADLVFGGSLTFDGLAVEPELADLGFDFDDLAVDPELVDLGFDGGLANASNKSTESSRSESEKLAFINFSRRNAN